MYIFPCQTIKVTRRSGKNVGMGPLLRIYKHLIENTQEDLVGM